MKWILSFWFCVIYSVCGAYTVQELSRSPRIFYISGFLSESECDHLISLARPNLVPSTVVNEAGGNGHKLDSRRSSQGMFLTGHRDDRKVKRIEKRIEEMTGLPRENGEALHVLYYPVGAEYQPHFDFFNPNTPGGAACLSRGGQRVASFIMYLNTPEAGGETVFPLVKISVSPKKGDAVLFYDCTESGECDRNTLHGGAPVIKGEKWIVTKWIRERVFK